MAELVKLGTGTASLSTRRGPAGARVARVEPRPGGALERAVFLAFCAALCPAWPAAAGEAADAAAIAGGLESITAAAVQATVDELTKDQYAGRDTPQRGLALACDYVAGRFRDLGLEPLGSKDGSYLRDYVLDVQDVAAGSTLVAAGQGLENDSFALGEAFLPAARTPAGAAEGELVFAGYAITEKKYRWDDFSGIAAKGKIAVALTREPRADAPSGKFFEGSEMTEASAVSAKAKNAAEQGAVGLILCPTSRDEERTWFHSQFPRIAGGGRGAGEELALPTVLVTMDLAERLLGRSPASLREMLDAKGRSGSFAVPGVRAHFEVKLESHPQSVPNVVARLRGAGDEVVVVGAHLDHIGVDERGRVYRGADDNAGGIASVLAVAEAFAKASVPMQRSIVFIAFTGEEKGLLGSAAYCRAPAVPAAKTFAMINLDIVTLGRPNAIEATFPSQTSALEKLLPAAVRISGCRLKVGRGGEQFFERSDQFSFHKVGIPTVFLNEGKVFDEIYHRWTDTPDRTLDDKVERVAKLAYALAYLAANSDASGGFK